MFRIPTGILVLTLLACPSLAQSAKPGFDSVDVNADGVITLAEFGTVFPTEGPRLFASVDKDNDGQVTVDEYALVTPPIEVAKR